MSTVEFYQDSKGEHRWHVLEDDEDGTPAAALHESKRKVTHACHEGFSSNHNAVQNLFINHAMMSIFVGAVARGDAEAGAEATGIYFEEDADQNVRWKIKSANGEIVGASHKGFDDTFEAMDNLVITYTMLTVFVAQAAQDKAADVR